MIGSTLLALLSLVAPQDGTIAADPIAYDQMVRCTAVFHVTAALEADGSEARRHAITQLVAFRSLARLHGAPLGHDETAVGAAMEAELQDMLRLHEMAEPRLFQMTLESDREICRIHAERIATGG
jgi:hypothetical protein